MRVRVAVLVLAIGASLVSACRHAHVDVSSCGGRSPASVDLHESVPPPPTVAEALWVADGSGTVRAYDAGTNEVSARVDLGGPTDLVPALASGGDLLWAYRFDSGAVAVIDPVTARVVARATVPSAHPLVRNVFRYAHGALWIAQPGMLWRITPTGEVRQTALPQGFTATTSTATARWLWLSDGGQLLRIDPADPSATRETAAPAGLRQLLGNGTGLYGTGTNTSEISILDTDTGERRLSVQQPGGETVMALVDAGDRVWGIGNCGDVTRMPDGVSTRVSDVSQDLPAAAGLGSLWVGDEVRSEVVRVSLRSGHILARIPFVAADRGDPAFWIVAGQASVWVLDSNFADGVSRLDPTSNRVMRLTPGRHATPGLSVVVSGAPRR